jgi:hypothetical protein
LVCIWNHEGVISGFGIGNHVFRRTVKKAQKFLRNHGVYSERANIDASFYDNKSILISSKKIEIYKEGGGA